MIPSEWSTMIIGSCLEKITLPASKLQTKDYRDSGKYPIVDQGQELIAGWTDREEGLIEEPLPLIIFGDHTRVFKYIDFPFIRGADGTQALKPQKGVDPRFFFYACLSLDISNRGYNRHFSILKEKEIPVPQLEEQIVIGQVLAQVETTRTLASDAAEYSAALKRAAMRELFTRGLRGEAQKETEIGLVPESWSITNLGSLGRIGNGSTPKKTVTAYWAQGTFPWLTSAKVYDREIVSADQFVTQKALDECHLPIVEPGAVLVAITGQGKTLGHCAVLKTRATINQHIAYLAVDGASADPSFVRGYLETQYDYLRQIASGGGSTKGALTCGFLRTMQLPLPSLPEQREIVTILDAIDRKIDLHRRKAALLQELFTALLHKLMTGEIRVGDLDLSALGPE